MAGHGPGQRAGRISGGGGFSSSLALFLYLAVGIAYSSCRSGWFGSACPETRAASGPARPAWPANRPRPSASWRSGTSSGHEPDDCGQAGRPLQQDLAALIDSGHRGRRGGSGFAIVEEKGTRKQRLVKVGGVVGGAKVIGSGATAWTCSWGTRSEP